MDDVDPLWKKVRDAVDRSIPVIELHAKELTPVLSVWWLMDKEDLEKAYKIFPAQKVTPILISLQAKHLLRAIISLRDNTTAGVLAHLNCAEYYAGQWVTEEKDNKGA